MLSMLVVLEKDCRSAFKGCFVTEIVDRVLSMELKGREGNKSLSIRLGTHHRITRALTACSWRKPVNTSLPEAFNMDAI